ncbi:MULTISPECIES: hypothetical protein [Pseudomonadota]|jgi:hypothetical protein|nr:MULTISPECIES: hypothetical protein [Pseudomonadota]HEP0387927.1 hypothetical protein [Serratia marcescens]EJA3269580.1 hypothetical protein [Pseudomonas aeruginosa]EKU0579536.1 hypothetical protein [Pseudomonas aeruginosa]ELM5224908.1 hypothetical protein [Pseudomonas aeruginosa]ELQ7930948.1 hypothetical protein [Pseudomonas aeruginosa]
MSKMIAAPERKVSDANGIILTPIDLAKEDPALFGHFQLHEQARDAEVQAVSSWYRSGSGPAPTQGGVWVGGSILVPLAGQNPPANAITNSIDYTWDNTNLRGWDSQVSVRLIIQAGSNAWEANVTAANVGSISAAGANIPANAQLQFQMRVGTLQVSLFNPPYISTNSVRVHYTY